MKNKNFLSIETSLKRIFLVLSFNEKVFSINKEMNNSIEVELNILIKEILTQANAVFLDLNFILVSLGPGSYTGTRVGLAAAKAISLALKIPLLGYSNFEAIYFEIKLKKRSVINDDIGVVITANRNELYYQKLGKNIKTELSKKKIINLKEVYKKNKLPNLIVGDQSLELVFNSYVYCIPSKVSILLIFERVYKKFLKKNSVELEPYYINGHYAQK